MGRVPVKSRLLSSIGYKNGILEVEMKKTGNIVHYKGVLTDEYVALISAESIGNYFSFVFQKDHKVQKV